MATRKPAGGKNGRGNGSTRSKKGEIEQPDVVETTLLMPEGSLVKSLAAKKLKLQKDNAESGGLLGQKIGEAVETKHLDRKAFSIACQFNKMKDHDKEKMAVTYFHLLRYMNDLDIPNTAKQHQGMFNAEETGPGVNGKDSGKDGANGKDKEGAAGGDNVTHIGAAARKVAEAAGDRG